MKKVTGALAVLLALTLTGCAGSAEDAGDERTAPVSSESAAPLVAETPTAEPEESDAEAKFIALVGESLPVNTIIPDATDEQLISAGMEACERLRAGETSDTITLIDGEQKNGADLYADSSAIITAARLTLCPDQV